MRVLVCMFLIGQVVILQSASIPAAQKCDCTTTVMMCSKQQLTAIPHCHMVTSVEILDVSYNKLRVIPNNSFTNFPNVKDVYLNDAHIVSLEADAFKSTPLLEKVDLSNNYIEYIQPDAFTGSANLQTVILSKNMLQLSQQDPLLLSSSVTTLDLSHCFIRHLPDGVISGLPRLQTLYLSYNSLTYLSPDTFTGLTDLTVVDVSNNEWKCDDNFRTAMCWIHERGQHATVPVTCYDRQHNRRKWKAESCSSVTAELPDIAVAPSDIGATQSDARPPHKSVSREQDWLFSKTFTVIDVVFLTVMLIISIISAIFTARWILRHWMQATENKNKIVVETSKGCNISEHIYEQIK